MSTAAQGQADVGVVGLGSMGGCMSLLFAEHGSHVVGVDVDPRRLNKIKKTAEELKLPIQAYDSLEPFAAAFKAGRPRTIILSLPHDGPIDAVLKTLLPVLDRDDIVIDGANEWYEETERRQKWCMKEKGVLLIGMGVSGGYQSARRGPSMSPGGPRDAYMVVEPMLKKWAAKDRHGNPCVAYIGPGGSGHYVKTIHNGIEQGIMGVLAEAYDLLRHTLGFKNDEVGDIFAGWNAKGELRGNFLVKLGSEIVKFKKGDGHENPEGIIDDIDDKVVQDVDEEEGTGVWTFREIAYRHVAGNTITGSHQMRIISANKGERRKVAANLSLPPRSKAPSGFDRIKFVETLRLAVYGGTLASFIQGMGIIARASAQQKWDVSLATCLNIWRAGCIIQSDYIADLLMPIVEKDPGCNNLLLAPDVARELSKTFESLEQVVRLALDRRAIIPSISSTLEYVKQVGSTELPTIWKPSSTLEHMYDLKAEKRPDPVKGLYHTEWRPA